NNRGQVTRHHYDNTGQKVQTVEYAQLVSTAQWLSATGTLTQSLAQLDTQLAGMANHVDNRTSYTLYTAAGKPEYKVDVGGFVTQYTYNAQGRLIEERTYTNKLKENEVSHLLVEHRLALETTSYQSSPLSNIQSQSEDHRFKVSGGIWRSNDGVYRYYVQRPKNPVIDDHNFKLQFDDSVVPESLRFSSVGSNLLIHLDNGEIFTVIGGVSSWIEFSLEFWAQSKTSLSKEYIHSLLNRKTLNSGYSGQDVLSDTESDDVIFGGEGNDLLQGSTGNDKYIYRKGDDVDIIQDIKGNNTLLISGYNSDDFSIHEFIQYDQDHLILVSDKSSDAIIINQWALSNWTLTFDDKQVGLSDLYNSTSNRNNQNIYLRTLGQTDVEFSSPIFETWNNRPNNIFLYWGGEDNYFEFSPEGANTSSNIEAVVVGGAGDDSFELNFQDDSTQVEYYGGKGDDYFYAMGNRIAHYHYSRGDGNDLIEGQDGDILEFHDLLLDDIHITSNIVNNWGSIKFLVKSTGETVTYEVFGNTAKIQLKDKVFRTDNLPKTDPHFNQPVLISSFETEIEVESDSRFVLPIRFDNTLESELSILPISLPEGLTFDAKTRELSGGLLSKTSHVIASFEASTKAHTTKIINIHIKNKNFIGRSHNLVGGDFHKVTIDYTAAGKIEYKTDPEGYVTRFYYDAAGNEVAQRQYANKGTTVSAQDRVSHTYYDGQGRVAGTLSADGALTTYTYTLAGQKQSKNVHHTQVRSQVIGGALAIPTGSKTTTSWTYTSTGQVESETRPDGSVEQYVYDKMGQLIEKRVYENAGTGNITRLNLASDLAYWDIYSNTSGQGKFTAVQDDIYGGLVTQLNGEGLSDGFRLMDPERGNLNSDARSIAWDMKYGNDFHVYISVETTFGHRYLFYTPKNYYVAGSTEPSQSSDKTYINHPLGDASTADEWITVNRNLVNDLKAMEPDNELLTINAFLIRGTGKVGHIELGNKSDADISHPETRIIANDNFTNNQLSGVFISNSGGSPITVKDERIEVKRLPAETSAWPSIRGNDYFNLSDNVEMRIEVTTGPTLAGSYLYGGIANEQSWGSGLLDRHAVYFTQTGVYSNIVENSQSQPHQRLMATQPNTTYVVTWTTSENETTLTVYPKGHPEQAVSRTESAVERTDKSSRFIMYGNPTVGANNSVLYLENYSLAHQTHNVERYQYDQQGRLV
ncbi:hypothetical protein J8L98_24230, partial [Pseudoalteromonas sp. MMG013]|uniref:hypothetical protein n=1 Tax=Pseudoalteromonas sp. MMG013 TaxID=2822687 RepID=UPI001B38163E